MIQQIMLITTPVQPNSIVNPNDYQLNQALNLIKALNITNKM